MAHALSAQTGLSLGAVLRLALGSGILVEATRVAPSGDGTYGGMAAGHLARALRRHLGSAIDLLLEQGQHPYHLAPNRQGGDDGFVRLAQDESTSRQAEAENRRVFDGSMGEELEALGIGLGLAETISQAEPLE